MRFLSPEGHRDDVEHQEELKRIKGRSNAESLFEMMNVPTDNHIRTVLEPVLPKALYRRIFQRLEQTGLLEQMQSHAQGLLIAIDGTEYFSSQKIHCPNCSHRELANGKTHYFHSVWTPVIAQAGNEHVIFDPPTPQDGHEKQDCEIEARKRWISTQGGYYAQRNVTLLGDDLFSRQPFCQTLTDQPMHFTLR